MIRANKGGGKGQVIRGFVKELILRATGKSVKDFM